MEGENQDSNAAKIEDNLIHLFNASVDKFGSRQCITHVNDEQTISWTYNEVNSLVDTLSDSLIFSAEHFIGIVGNEMTPEMIFCILRVLKSRAAFVFLNTTEIETSTASAEKLCISHVIGETFDVGKFISQRWNVPFNFIKLFYINEKEFGVSSRIPESCAAAENVPFAFAVFSSGSTKSVPKIIKVPHRSILPNIFDLKKIYQLNSTDTLYISTPPTFDPCIHDVFLAFSAGCRILLTNSALKYRSPHLQTLFSSEGFKVTVFFTTPSIFRKWFPQIGSSSLRILTLGGEPFPSIEYVRQVIPPEVRVYNIYGITEVSCWASIVRVHHHSDQLVSLGSPLSDTIFEVRQEDGNVVVDGIGELFIGSNNRICIVDDDLDVFDSRPCFRASGDLVRISDREHFYVGRKDRRTKLYGHQIDFSSIEDRILRHSAVKNCLTFASNEQIIALVELISPSSRAVTAETLKEFASQDLPSHMLPHDILIVSEFPLNSHGKISPLLCEILYQRLKCPKSCEEEFRELWLKYTGQSSVNADDGFIDSGGNSFAALQLTGAFECNFNVPRNLLELLVTNQSFSNCVHLITSKYSNKLPTNVANNDRKNNEVDILFHRKKKMKVDDCLIWTLHKGHPLRSTIDLPITITINLKWKYNLEKCVDASPTLLVFNDRTLAVCGSHSGLLIIVEVETGSIISKLKLPDRIESSPCASSDGCRVFLGCYDGRMYAIDVVTAFVKWSFQTDDIIKSTAVLYNNMLFFGSYDHNFYCLSSVDGILLWKVNIDHSAIYATAIVRSDIIIAATLSGTVAFIDHEGVVQRKKSDMKPIFSNPIEILILNVFLVVDVTGFVRCFDLHSFSELWRTNVCGCVFSSLSTTMTEPIEVIFGSQNGRVTCLRISRVDGQKLWECVVSDQVYSTPICCENWRSIIVISTNGNVSILNSASGEFRANFSIGGPVFSSPVAHETSVVVGCRDNYLYCLAVS